MALTLRLSEIESAELDKIKAQMNVKTATQAIVKIIMAHNDLVERNKKLQQEKTRIESDKIKLHVSIKGYLSALDNLKDVINK
ncbi:hypothetical protein RHO13_13160 (plasmid) [Orbus wheelerorum]|uniref:hypothetical protein n=1 Tax=Orbus wheelerorum TaxID=3074111 RepID=UPI00370DBBDB